MDVPENIQTRRRIKKANWPKCLKPFKELKGLYVGGCADGSPWDSDGYGGPYDRNALASNAHAHLTYHLYPNVICLREEKYLLDEATLLHEMAHVLSQQGHNDIWRRCLLKIGGTLDATETIRDYHKIPRKKIATQPINQILEQRPNLWGQDANLWDWMYRN